MKSLKIKWIVGIVIMIGAVAIVLNFFDFKKSDIHSPSTELSVINYIPRDDDSAFLTQPRKISFVDDTLIYVSDIINSKIMIFSINGDYLFSIGEKGHGPGEFMNQRNIIFDGDQIIVNDPRNRRIQFLDKQGKYISSFRTNYNISEIEIANNSIFSFIEYDLFENVDQYPLITVFDYDGNIVNSFGSHLLELPNAPSILSRCIFRVYKNKLFVLFKYYPILHIYTLDGELLAELRFENSEYKSLIEANYKKETFANPTHVTSRYLFFAFDVNTDGIFISVFTSDITIDQYDFDGNFVRRYYKKHNNRIIYVTDLRAIPNNYSDILFYVSQLNGMPSVTTYGINIE